MGSSASKPAGSEARRRAATGHDAAPSAAAAAAPTPEAPPDAAALLQGGQDRFRPIILTSLTTFVGLMPIMSETSVQAQFLIPMVISLAFGVLFATGVTLLLVPCLYLLGEQVSSRLPHGRPPVPDVIDGV